MVKDRIFKAVISDERLIALYGYDPERFGSIDDGLISDNVVINAVAQIINLASEDSSETRIYNTVYDYLNKNI